MDKNIGESTDSQSALGQVAIPYVTDLRQEIINNTLFYTTKWTSRNMQFALISVPPNSETGLDVHYYSDQFFYVERGDALVIIRSCYDCPNIQSQVHDGYGIIVPGGMWHNIINIGGSDLKMFSIFAPALHSYNTVFRTTQEWFDYYEYD